ncbi:dynamin-binding protein-like isoform X1 [Vespa crabro]|uniref:dynamin-binding protein-like isoform X1 n=2 Tax=Vespa crabro TaxID=7445 RepID=UPI001F00F924|nr:dynamin-binding protein-like isoform X1 [Vespa crabro]
MESGSLTKVLHDFFTTIDGELSLYKGEHFLIHKVIDKHWCYGQSNNKTGNFPLNHLHKVEIPFLLDTQSLFVSIAAFAGEQSGDLSFGAGDLIIGIHEVGSGWYYGQIDSRVGIFPTTHTWQLDTNLIKRTGNKKSIRKKGRVKATLKAQLEEELDLNEGEVVTVIEVLDDGWCRGITEDGRNGIFPEGFISYMNDETSDQTDTCVSRENVLPSSLYNINSVENNVSNSYSVQSYKEEDPAPSYYDLFPQFSTSKEKVSEDNNRDDNANSFDVKPYAITLYPFNAQFPNELNFGVGEIVHLIKHVDSEWMEGSIDDNKGIFPISYVNIVVDCPEMKAKEEILNKEDNSTEYTLLEPGTMAKVEYTFKAQMDGDLNITEGDIVTIISMANENWINVKNVNGEIGLCPRGYLSSSPISEPNTDSTMDLLEDFVVLRDDKPSSLTDEEYKPKRLSEPHRPAPPVPAPGRMPLQNSNKDLTFDNACASEISIDINEKKADQRQNVISELVLTEKEYVRDLTLTYETFNLSNPDFLKAKGIDVDVLFGNILEIIQVAEELLHEILRAMKGCDEQLQQIGTCFTKMASKLRVVYVKYCGNHEAALALLKKYENNEEIMSVFNKGTETLRYQIACFDMSSILIKPVQRILKYPLILFELIKCTEDDHPDKLSVKEAWKAMTDVACYINEYKRRKDLVLKYLDNDNTLIRKMAKLNMHSVAKMSTRLSTKLSASLGLTNIAVDPVFEELERQFRSIEKCTWQLAKDVEMCVIYLSDEAISGEVMSDYLNQYYQGTPNLEIKRIRDIRSLIWSQFMQDLKSCLEIRLNVPLNLLTTFLEGPAILITKRHDKLLDYDAAISKSEKYKDSKIVQDELATAKGNFEALNQQLLEELPILIDAAMKVLVKCINAFANARKLLSGRITKRYLKLCEITTQVSLKDILESFLVNHNLLWNQIARFSFGGTNQRTEEEKEECCSQDEEERILLTKKYTRDKLYVLKENVTKTTSLDLGATKGSLVAVIKNQDPMGDITRWLVDNGTVKGFLPANKLTPLQQIQQPIKEAASMESNVNRNTDSMTDLISMISPEKEAKPLSESNLQSLLYLNIDEELNTNQIYSNIEEISKTQTYQNLTYEFYYTMYDFAGGIPGTLPAKKGKALRLIRPHDEKGNDEWWLVEDRYGQSGYVPKNYLTPAPQTKP